MSQVVNLECSCGTVKGTVKIVEKSYFHVHCLCCDCQNFSDKLKNKERILDKHGGSELFQTYPNLVAINQGQDKIGCLQLKEKGLLRWYTTCCNMPLANTMGSYKIPFVGLSVKLMKFIDENDKNSAIGPVTLKAFGKYSIGDKPVDTHERFPLSYMPKILLFMIKGMFKKSYKPSPFFKQKNPIINPERIY